MPFVYEIDSPGVCSPLGKAKGQTWNNRLELGEIDSERSPHARGWMILSKRSASVPEHA
jgi:hypothetical protein